MLESGFESNLIMYSVRYVFLIFTQKIGFDISCKLLRDNWHEMSKPIFYDFFNMFTRK